MKFPSLNRNSVTEQETTDDYFQRVHGVVLVDVRTTKDNLWHLRYAYHPSAEVQAAFALNPNITMFWIFNRFLNSEHDDVRVNLITNPALSSDLLVQHLSRLDPHNNQADLVDFQAAVDRAKLIREAGADPEPRADALLQPFLTQLKH